MRRSTRKTNPTQFARPRMTAQTGFSRGWSTSLKPWMLHTFQHSQAMLRGSLAGLGILTVGMAAAYAVANMVLEPNADVRQETVSITLPAPAIKALELAPDSAAAEIFIHQSRVQNGDNLASLLARMGVNDKPALDFARKDAQARALFQLQAGRSLRVESTATGELRSLSYALPQNSDANPQQLVMNKESGAWRAQTQIASTQNFVEMKAAQIAQGGSLFGASDAAGIPDAVTMKLTEIFDGEVDFYRVRPGDRFSVIYDTAQTASGAMKSGRLLAAEFVQGAKTVQALWFAQADEGRGGYYNFDGISLRKAFLREPLEFTRVSSGFSLSRLHPILHTQRAHKGIDFAAPLGTPVRSVGDGVVTFVGRKGGYGNVVEVKHHGQFSTLYAHLNSFADKLRLGQRVAQSDIIGTVGRTGWATGPHLHYEFKVAEVQQDPASIDLPRAAPLTTRDKQLFVANTRELKQRIDLLAPLAAK